MSTPSEAAQKEDNWDSYGAKPTSEKAVETAERICGAWAPMNNGGLLLEFIAEDGRELMVDIDPSGTITIVNFEVPFLGTKVV